MPGRPIAPAGQRCLQVARAGRARLHHDADAAVMAPPPRPRRPALVGSVTSGAHSKGCRTRVRQGGSPRTACRGRAPGRHPARADLAGLQHGMTAPSARCRCARICTSCRELELVVSSRVRVRHPLGDRVVGDDLDGVPPLVVAGTCEVAVAQQLEQRAVRRVHPSSSSHDVAPCTPTSPLPARTTRPAPAAGPSRSAAAV